MQVAWDISSVALAYHSGMHTCTAVSAGTLLGLSQQDVPYIALITRGFGLSPSKDMAFSPFLIWPH